MYQVPVGYFRTTITNKILAGATEIPIDSVVDKAGNSLDGLIISLVADRGTNIEEGFTGEVDAAGSRLINVIGGLDPLDGTTSVAGLKHNHGTKAPIEMTSFPYVTLAISVINGDIPFGGVPSNPAVRVISTNRQIADKEYVDTVAAAAGGISDLLAVDAGGITINVNSGKVIVGSAALTYAGVAGQALTDNATNYVQLRYDGTLSVRTDQFVDGYIPIAQVTTLAGDITVLTDKRPWFSVGPGNQVVDTSVTYGATLSFGDFVYVDASASNKLKKALATTFATSSVSGIAIESGVDGDTPKRVLIEGIWANASGLTPNAPVYLSDTGTASSTPGTVPVLIGWAKSATAFHFKPNLPQLETPRSANLSILFGSEVGGAISPIATTCGYSDATVKVTSFLAQEGSANQQNFVTAYQPDNSLGDSLIPYSPSTNIPGDDGRTTQGVVVIGTDVFTSSDSGTAGNRLLKNGTRMTISGTTPGNSTALGHDPNLSYLLVQNSTTTVLRYSGIAGTTATFVDTITLSSAVTAKSPFIFDAVNDRYIFLDKANNLVKRFGSTGTLIDSVAYTFDDTEAIGVTMKNNRVFVVAMKAMLVGVIGNCQVALIPTRMTR